MNATPLLLSALLVLPLVAAEDAGTRSGELVANCLVSLDPDESGAVRLMCPGHPTFEADGAPATYTATFSWEAASPEFEVLEVCVETGAESNAGPGRAYLGRLSDCVSGASPLTVTHARAGHDYVGVSAHALQEGALAAHLVQQTVTYALTSG